MKNHKNFILILAILALILIAIFQAKNIRGNPLSEFVGEDFAGYWASGRLLLAGENPYSPDKLFELERSIGWTRGSPLVPYNPPWAIVFVLPFAVHNYEVGKMLWLCSHFLLVFFASIFFLRYYLSPGKTLSPWMILIVFSFAPIWFMLKKGQIASLMLLGFVLFLWLEKKEQFFLAGMVTILLAIKPHAALLFWPVLILWICKNRKWSISLGCGSAVLLSLGLSLSLNRSLPGQYIHLLQSQSPATNWMTPSVGTFLRVVLGLGNKWLQFVPVFAGFVWIIFYWAKHREDWAWAEHIPLILAASLISTFYIWLNDFVLLLPATIHGILIFWNRRKYFRVWPILAYALLNGLVWFFPSQNEFWYFWIPPTWFIFYIVIKSKPNSRNGQGNSRSENRVSVRAPGRQF